MKILVVDDSPTALIHSRYYLEEAAQSQSVDVHIETADSAEQALECVALSMPDLIVLDVVLPGMSGFEFCKRIKAENDFVKVVYVTGTVDQHIIDQAKDSNGDYFVLKPITKNSFSDIIEKEMQNQCL